MHYFNKLSGDIIHNKFHGINYGFLHLGAINMLIEIALNTENTNFTLQGRLALYLHRCSIPNPIANLTH